MRKRHDFKFPFNQDFQRTVKNFSRRFFRPQSPMIDSVFIRTWKDMQMVKKDIKLEGKSFIILAKQKHEYFTKTENK